MPVVRIPVEVVLMPGRKVPALVRFVPNANVPVPFITPEFEKGIFIVVVPRDFFVTVPTV